MGARKGMMTLPSVRLRPSPGWPRAEAPGVLTAGAIPLTKFQVIVYYYGNPLKHWSCEKSKPYEFTVPPRFVMQRLGVEICRAIYQITWLKAWEREAVVYPRVRYATSSSP